MDVRNIRKEEKDKPVSPQADAEEEQPEKKAEPEHGKLTTKRGRVIVSQIIHLNTFFLAAPAAGVLSNRVSFTVAGVVEGSATALGGVLFLNESTNFISELCINKDKRKTLDGVHSVTRQNTYLGFRILALVFAGLATYFLITGANAGSSVDALISNETDVNTTGVNIDGIGISDSYNLFEVLGIVLSIVERILTSMLDGKKPEAIGNLSLAKLTEVVVANNNEPVVEEVGEESEESIELRPRSPSPGRRL